LPGSGNGSQQANRSRIVEEFLAAPAMLFHIFGGLKQHFAGLIQFPTLIIRIIG